MAPPATFFRQVYDTFCKAQQHPNERNFQIGDYSVKLCFANDALKEKITPALDHLACDPVQSPDLTICLFDSSSVPMPPPPWPPDAYGPQGSVLGYNDDTIRTSYHIEPGILSMLHLKQSLGIFWIRDAAQVPYWETGSPLRTILHWWMSSHARLFTHAAAVGTDDGGVLLVGKGGSGKSTTALTCLKAGFHYAADDYCLLKSHPSPYVYSAYHSAKIDQHTLNRFPHLESLIWNKKRPPSDKALVFLKNHFPNVSPGFPLKAILVPQIAHLQEPTLTPISSATALKALAPSTIFQLPEGGTHTLAFAKEIADKVACFRLNLSDDATKSPPLIRKLLQEISP